MEILDYELDGIDSRDYPDFVDAFITWACWENGQDLTDKELEALNEDRDFVYNAVLEKLF
jgi:hypothetical protein